MLEDMQVTLFGRVGGDVQVRDAGGSPVANFRLGCTPRRKSRDGEWSDDETQWYSVSAWRQLGEHCGRSLRTGDPVVVVGRLRQRSWINKSGVEVTSLEIEAGTVAHDLRWGTTTYARRPRPADEAAA